jgi:pyruvate carboxylase
VPISKILVANRSEIAIRVFRAANELGMKTVAIWAEEDKLALHRFKADESYQVGRGPHLERDLGPIESYLSIDEVIRVAKLSGADAIHPGYGLLSESPEFADACAENGIIFIGPRPETMRRLGNKVAARNLAIEVGVPVVPATEPLPDDMDEVARMADEIGYPVMLKASWGGGGRGMRAIRDPKDLVREVTEAKREAKAAFGKDEVYLEKLVERARHVESQILGDTHGNAVHLFERDCSVQRRNQKVVERAPAPYLTEAQRQELAAYSLKIANATGYVGAGTVEYLMDIDTGAFYFIEVNPRIQVEHTVTEEVTGVDIVQAQLRVAAGEAIGSSPSVCRRSPTSGSVGTRYNAASRPRSRKTISCRTTAVCPRIEAHRVSVFAWTAARPIPGARDHTVLRLAAGQSHRVGADTRECRAAHGPGAARVPRARR